MKAYSPVKRTGSQVEYDTKHAHYMNVRHTNIIRKVVPLVSLLYKNKWHIKSGDAGTIDRFDLTFQYQIKTYVKKNEKQMQI